MRGRRILVPVLALAVASATVAEAQRRPSDRVAWSDREPDPRPGGWVGLGLIVADPVGEFGQVVDVGGGAILEGSLPVTRDGGVRLKADVGFLIYGHEQQTVCFPAPVGCRIGLDLTTSNNIFFFGVGPEFTIPNVPVQPYVNATGGFSYFATTSSLSGVDEAGSWADTRNFDDFVGAFKAGAGVRTQLRGGRKPIALDLGVQYHRNGVAEYLREGDIEDHPDGSITLHPRRSEANLLAWRIGVSFGIPRGGDEARRGPRRRR